MPNSRNRDRYIIIRYENGRWIGHAHVPGWCLVTLPYPTEVEALIAALSIIRSEPGGSNID
jgi:hypothetical protein